MVPDSRSLVQLLARRLGAELVETHISWVLLLPELAYKIKKPVRLPFVDYSTPERRLHFCLEELRLNQRTAPGLYLGVARVSGPADAPGIDGAGETFDYAVRMRRFPPGALFSERARDGSLAAPEVDRLAERLTAFHRTAPQCPPDAGGPTLGQRAMAAFDGTAVLIDERRREELRAWLLGESERVAPLWQARRVGGHLRELHGDLHLANLLWLDGEVLAFDCVEFDRGLRCIDPIEDVAFTLMDFAARGQPALGWRFINAWLEGTGDYEGVGGLRLCLVYRALVRAMAENLREPGAPAAAAYARQALGWTATGSAALSITHGLPGSGKSFVSQQLLEARGAIRIRSDVERKRLHGLDALARSHETGLAIYTPDATRRTYARMFELARVALQAGWPVVLDAAFLTRAERQQARQLAVQLQVPFSILACDAPAALLRDRLAARTNDASEADVHVLERLQAAAEPLDDEERQLVARAAA
jgi:aminoglycoside phosphotransferase family enzyme/predicted kinase